VTESVALDSGTGTDASDAGPDVVADSSGDVSEVGMDTATGPSLEISPNNSFAVCDVGGFAVPPPIALTVTRHDGTGATSDVTTTATFTLDDPTVGSVGGGKLGASCAGLKTIAGRSTIVRAKVDPLTAAAAFSTFHVASGGDPGARDLYLVTPYLEAPLVATTKARSTVTPSTKTDVHVRVINDPTNPAGVDATKLIKSLRLATEVDAMLSCFPVTTKDTDGDGVADTFVGVSPGSWACVELTAKTNDTLPATDKAQFPKAAVVFEDPSGAEVGRKIVRFLVLPKTP